MKIQTQRLTIEPVTLNDASFVKELVNTEDWIENIGQRNVHSLREARAYIEDKMLSHYRKHGYGNYKMTLTKEHEEVGCVSLYNRETVEGVDIGFALFPDYYKQGYAFEGASALLEYAIHHLKIDYLTGFTTPENYPSQSLLLKLGFVKKKEFIWEETGETLILFEFMSREP